MGVVNVTPDSFSGDGLLRRHIDARRYAEDMVSSGADIIDVGGESIRPGSQPVSLQEELSRVIPVIERLSGIGAPISIDTSKAEVARLAILGGASMVNDVSGLGDASMAAVVAESGAWLVIVDNGSVVNRGRDAHRVAARLIQKVAEAERAGVQPEKIIVDPGLGMGKRWYDNLTLMANLQELQQVKKPVLVGPSRKGMIGHVLGVPPEDRFEGSAALVTLCIAYGADVVRVHDVRRMADVVRVSDELARS
jgi:dihydropteroate synthase